MSIVGCGPARVGGWEGEGKGQVGATPPTGTPIWKMATVDMKLEMYNAYMFPASHHIYIPSWQLAEQGVWTHC